MVRKTNRWFVHENADNAFSGTFNKSNNQIMQLESMIRIIKKYPQAKLILIGQGNLKEYYEHIIEKYELNENVEIIENTKDTVNILSILKPVYNFKAH